MLIVPFLTISVMSVTRVWVLFFLIIKKWKSERPNKILGPNLGFGGSKIGMSCQNRDTWQIWARIPVIIISILGNIVLSDFYIGLAQFRRPYVPIFRSFSYKNAGFKSTKITTKANTKSGNSRKHGEFSCLNDIYYETLEIITS